MRHRADIRERLLWGKTLTLDGTTKNTTIRHIKHLINIKNGVAAHNQRLNFASKKLKNGHTIGYYKIQRYGTIQLLLRLRGGGKFVKSKLDKASHLRAL